MLLFNWNFENDYFLISFLYQNLFQYKADGIITKRHLVVVTFKLFDLLYSCFPSYVSPQPSVLSFEKIAKITIWFVTNSALETAWKNHFLRDAVFFFSYENRENLLDILFIADSYALTWPLCAPVLLWKLCAHSLKESQLFNTCELESVTERKQIHHLLSSHYLWMKSIRLWVNHMSDLVFD